MLKTFTDQMGRVVEINHPPGRIISLVPSQTELLWWLGLKEEVAGITKFCIHPDEWFRSKTRIGGTKKFDFDKIAALKPDLIIGNKEENEELQIRQIMHQYPVWMSDIHTLDDAFDMMKRLGELVDKSDKATELVSKVKEKFTELRAIKFPERKAAYFIWRAPYMVAGNDTFINNMLALCNLKNVFAEHEGRYPEVNTEELKARAPDVILLSSEPYPFSAKHIDEFRQMCPGAKIVLADGEYFSWYGSRLLGAPEYFTELLTEIE